MAIPSGDILEGSLKPNKLKLVQAWIEIHQDDLLADWELASAGEAVFNTNKQTKQAALAVAPFLSGMYSDDDSIFELFYINNATATFRDMKGKDQTIKF